MEIDIKQQLIENNGIKEQQKEQSIHQHTELKPDVECNENAEECGPQLRVKQELQELRYDEMDNEHSSESTKRSNEHDSEKSSHSENVKSCYENSSENSNSSDVFEDANDGILMSCEIENDNNLQYYQAENSSDWQKDQTPIYHDDVGVGNVISLKVDEPTLPEPLDNQGQLMPESDINASFDNILHSEENVVKTSFDEGYKNGQHEGKIEGYNLGYKTGVEIGKELGSIYGFVVAHQSLEQPPRMQSALNKLRKAIEIFPTFNDPEQDVQSAFMHIRRLHRHIYASLHLHPARGSEMNVDLSF